MGQIFIDLEIIYSGIGIPKEVVEYFNSALELRDETRNYLQIVNLYNSLAGIYSENQLETSVKYHKKALDIYYKFKDPFGTAYTYNLLGMTNSSNSINNGVKFTLFATEVEASLSNYEWTVLNTLSDKCMISIDDASPSIYDKSDSDFSITGAVNVEDKDNIPSEYLLNQNYPNPFNPSTKIRYAVPKASFVLIKVFNVSGREVETLVSGEKYPGDHEVEFNASNLTTCIYFVEFRHEILFKLKSFFS